MTPITLAKVRKRRRREANGKKNGRWLGGPCVKVSIITSIGDISGVLARSSKRRESASAPDAVTNVMNRTLSLSNPYTPITSSHLKVSEWFQQNDLSIQCVKVVWWIKLGTPPSASNYPTTAYILSLIAGILIIVSSSFTAFWTYTWLVSWDAPYISRMQGAMMPHWGDWVLSPLTFVRMTFTVIAVLSLVSGIVILVSALLLRSRPKEHTSWGTLILIFSILSFFGMGGFFIGALLGIIGGALAISWQLA